MITCNMRMTGEEIVGFEFGKSTEFRIRVAVSDREAKLVQRYEAASFQASATDQVHCLAKTLTVIIAVAKNKIAGKYRTLLDHIGNRQVATVNQDLGSPLDELGHCGTGCAEPGRECPREFRYA